MSSCLEFGLLCSAYHVHTPNVQTWHTLYGERHIVNCIVCYARMESLTAVATVTKGAGTSKGSIVLFFYFLCVFMLSQAQCCAHVCLYSMSYSVDARALLIRPMIAQPTSQLSCLHKVFFPSFTSSEQYSHTAPTDALLPSCLKGTSHFLLKWPINVASEKAIHVCLSSK